MKFRYQKLNGRKGRKINWKMKEACQILDTVINLPEFRAFVSEMNEFELSHEEDDSGVTGKEFLAIMIDLNISPRVAMDKGSKAWWQWKISSVCGWYWYGKTTNINYYYAKQASILDIIDTIFHEAVHMLDNYTPSDFGHGDNSPYFYDGRFKGDTAPWKLGKLVRTLAERYI